MMCRDFRNGAVGILLPTFFVLFCIAVPGITQAQGVTELGGYHFGPPEAVAISDGDAWVSSGAFIKSYGSFGEKPQAPVLEMPFVVQAMQLVGDDLVAVDKEMLKIFDTVAFTESGSLYLPTGGEHEMFILGNYAYVSEVDGDLTVIDISDSSSPDVTGSLSISGGDLMGIAAYGNYVYLASDYEDAILVISVVDPANPVMVTQVDLSEDPYPGGLKIINDYLYVFPDYDEFYAFDLADPSAPSEVNVLDIGTFRSAAVYGTNLYVAQDEGAGFIEVFDCTTGMTPTPADTLELTMAQHSVQLAVGPSYAIFSTDGGGDNKAIHIDLSTKGKGVPDIQEYTFEDEVALLGVWEDLVITCGEQAHASFFDVRVPGSISKYSELTLPVAAADLDVKDGMVAFACGSEGAVIVDLSTPGTYTIRDLIPAGGSLSCSDVCLYGNYLLAGYRGNSAVYIYDISVPGAAVQVDSKVMGGGDDSIVFSNTWIRLSNNSILTSDITDPENIGDPVQHLSDQFIYPKSGAMADHYLLYASGLQGMQIVDILDTDIPINITTYSDGSVYMDITIMSDRAYMADWEAGLKVLDISNPLAPSLIWQDSNYFLETTKVAMQGGRLIARGNGVGGFTLFEDPDVVASYLADISAVRQDGEAVLSWRIFGDTGLKLFHVWRGDENAPQERVTTQPVTGIDRFSWSDPATPGGETVYWIEEVTGGDSMVLGSVRLAAGDIPGNPTLSDPWPNPFNPMVNFRMDVPGDVQVQMGIYDLQGRLVVMLVDGLVSAGSEVFSWNGTNGIGEAVGSGVYFARAIGDGFYENRKLMLVR